MKVSTNTLLTLKQRCIPAALFALLALLFTVGANAQISLTDGSAYTQDFNSLANSGTSSSLPAGWAFSESGSNANSTYAAGTGSDNGGNTYSYGPSGNSDRAFGTLLSGSLTSTIGASFINNTGNEITEIAIDYTGELWRLGTAGRTDRLDFQYSLNASSLTSGTWIDVDELDFSTPNTTGSAGARNGNDAAYRTSITHTISGLSIPNGATIFIRWTDFNASGADDGLAVDDFSLTPTVAASNPPVVTPPPGGLLMGAVGTPFSYFVDASNDPTEYAVTTGTLPAGLTLNTTTGEISGTPNTADFYSADITATNSGGTSAAVTHEFFIDLGNQSISFDPLAGVSYGDAPFNLTATATSGLPVSYSSDNPFVATVSGNTVTIVGAGTANITASQSGDANYNAAADVTQPLVVSKASQTITFDALIDKTTADAPFALTATASSGLPVSYVSSDPAVATISGNIVTIVASGTTTITASQAGDGNYDAAADVDQLQLVTDASKLDQTITFNPLANATYGDAPITLTATASSSLPVSYISSDDAVATVSGNTLTITGVGSVTITASQDGDATYNPAPTVDQTLVVDAKALTITGIVVNDKIYDGTTSATLDQSGASLVGVVGADDVSYTVTDANFASADAGTGIDVVINLSLTGSDAGNYTLPTSITLSGNILQASQTITFDPLPAKTTNDAPFQLTATASSALTVTYISSNPSVATVTGDMVTIVGAGTTTITASQDGNTNYAAATDVNQELVVTLAPSTFTWNFGTTSPNPSPSSGTPVNNLTISDFDQGNNSNTSQTTLQLNTTSNSSSGGFSGAYNASITAENDNFDAEVSAYFEFTLSPNAGYSVTLNDLDFGARSTSTGPTEISIFTSADNFTSSIDVLNPNNNSNWTLMDASFAPVTSSAPLTIRIYGYQPGGSGSVGSSSANNWRLDDVTVSVLVEALPGCDGTPEAGSASADGGPFCESGSATITAADYTLPEPGNGIGLQWYSSTDNVNFTPVVDATSGSISTGTITETTYYYLEVTCSNSGLSDVTNTVTVTVNPAPDAPVITGNASICTGSSTTLTSTPAASYAWFLDGNPVGSNSITHEANVAGSYTVQITDANGCTAGSLTHVVMEGGAPATPVITGPTNVCEFVGTGTPVVFTASFDPNATSYTWTVPPTVSIVSGQGTSTLTVTINSGFIALANKQIRAVAHTDCGTSGIGVKYLHAQFPVTPSPISGPANVCDYIGNGLMAAYSIAPVTAATGYVWTLPTGVTMVEDNGTDIVVTFTNDFVTSNILVRATNPCGTSSNRAITVARINPSTPGLIAGTNNVCMFMPTAGNPAGTHAFYSVPLVSNASSYTWTVPAGLNIVNQTSTATDNVIEVEVTPAYTSGNISVVAENNCGSSVARNFTLTVHRPSTPSAIDVVQLSSCPGRIYSYSLAGMPANTTEIVWTVPTGGTILSGEGTASIQVQYTDDPISGNVSVTASNGCGSSGTRTISVKLPGCPPPAMKAPVTTAPAISGVEVEALEATIFPNPSHADFRLKVNSKANTAMQLRVLDITGKTVTVLQARAGEIVTFGSDLKPGTYFVEVMNGKDRKVVKVIKL